MSDMGDAFREVKEAFKERMARLGVNCPACAVKLPKAIPKVLLPGQKCWCGYRDPRPNQAHEFWQKG